MRTTSALYKSLRSAVGSYYDVEVINGLTTYTVEDLVSIQISSRLLKDEGISLGNTCSAECKLKLRESSDNWARMSSFSVRARLSSYDGTQKSEWLNLGTYYTDERSEDKYGNLQIIGYDEMLKLEIGWTTVVPEEDIPATFPITAKAMATLLATHVGFTIDNPDNIDDTLAFVGLDTTLTAREYMSMIASGCGSSWVVTMDNKFRLVPLINGATPDEYAIAGIAIAGVAVVGTSSAGVEGYPFYGIEDIGLSAMDLISSPMFQPVSGIIFTAESLEVDQCGDNSGFVLKEQFNFSRSGTAELAMSRLSGYQYRPFDTNTALVDPALELGDVLICNDTKYQTASFVWKVSPHITADVSAPVDAEVDHEYPYLDEAERTYNKLLTFQNEYDEAYSEIMQDIGQINLEVAQKVGDDEIISRINLSPESIVIQANRVDFSGAVTFNDLDTPGQSVINGSNISGGTLTLGGRDNISGVMVVNDYNGDQCTRVDYLGIYTNSLNATTSVNIDAPIHGSIKMPGNGTNSTIEMSTGNGFYYKQYYEPYGYQPYYNYYKIFATGFEIGEEGTNTYMNLTPGGIKTQNGHDTSIGFDQSLSMGDGGYATIITARTISTNGTKNRILQDEQLGEIRFFCVETPSPVFCDIGEGVLDETGICIIDLDPQFTYAATLKGYQVFLQKYGNGDCWVSERNTGYFVVEGTPGMSFGWEIKAKQADYEQVRYNNPFAYEEEEGNSNLIAAYAYMEEIIERSIA